MDYSAPLNEAAKVGQHFANNNGTRQNVVHYLIRLGYKPNGKSTVAALKEFEAQTTRNA